MTDNFREKISSGCAALGIGTDSDKLEKLFRYYEMVTEKNKVMNLTSITDENEFITKHIIDSLSIVKSIDLAGMLESGGKYRMIDIGTGAGFPGMVLKIVFPELDVTLFDSLKKRLNFLDEVTEELGLDGIRTLHGRAEDYGRNKEYRDSFDLVFSRAVANMSSLSEYCLPFVKVGGIFAAYKTSDSAEEIKAAEHAIAKLGGKTEKTDSFVLPGSDIGRSIVIVRKLKKTPGQYPRKAGMPTKEPLD